MPFVNLNPTSAVYWKWGGVVMSNAFYNDCESDPAAIENGGFTSQDRANFTSEALKGLPIAIIDPQRLHRECLSRAICANGDLKVLSYSSIDEWQHQRLATSLVVLCQTRLAATEAMAEIERLTELSKCPAVILSDSEDPDLIVRMLGRNIRGFIPTSLSIDIALQAIELARAGGVYVPASSLIAAHKVKDNPSTVAQRANGMFTARQAAVVEALRRGKANKIIAYELKMRESTVKVHVRNIMKKLHATNRTEVAYLANRLMNGEEIAG